MEESLIWEHMNVAFAVLNPSHYFSRPLLKNEQLSITSIGYAGMVILLYTILSFNLMGERVVGVLLTV